MKIFSSPSGRFREILLFWLPVFLILFGAGLAARYGLGIHFPNSNGESGEETSYAKNNGLVLGEGEAGNKIPKSENYSAPFMSTGSEAVIFGNAGGQKETLIENVKSDIVVGKNKKEKKLFIAWATTKPTKCKIEYGKFGAGTGGLTLEEESYGTEHRALISSLESATTYSYAIKARDKWGNEKESDKFAVYTGAPQISFLEMIAGAFKDTFGWAMKQQ